MSSGRILIEAAVESPTAAAAAERAGADRVELCADLDAGGVTPSPAKIAETLELVRVPVHVMIRPRPGNFAYSPAEVETMCRSARMATAAGASGIVCGALGPDGDIDDGAMARIYEEARGRGRVFHRAFDVVDDPLRGLERLISLGADTVLTAGGAPTALEGLSVLRALARAAGGRICIMAGGSVTGDHVGRLVSESGVQWVHARSDEDGRRIAAIAAALRGFTPPRS